MSAKLNDFGAIQLTNGEFAISGTSPWQAPEINREMAFKVDAAKRTDNFSFGMLLWRVCLDGDPFKSLGDIQGTREERRQKRNVIITEKKKNGTLIPHVCQSLALFEGFTKHQLRILCDVISITLPSKAQERELHISQVIKLLTYDTYYLERHPITPSRMPSCIQVDLINFDKWYAEFEGLSTVVQSDIVSDLCEYAASSSSTASANAAQYREESEKRIAAAYQLAICYANGFGGKFQPEECLKWLSIAAKQGSTNAQDALRSFQKAFPGTSSDNRYSPVNSPDDEDKVSMLSSSWVSDFPVDEVSKYDESKRMLESKGEIGWLRAAQRGDYETLETLLNACAKLSSSADGVTPLHFLSSWDVKRAEGLGRKLVEAGANVDAFATPGLTRGGTALMWSVLDDHIEHTRILLDLGANPMVAPERDEDALSVAAKLHLMDHLRLLMEYVRPRALRGHLARLFEAATGGDSRFTRITRHGADWQVAAIKTFDFLEKWNSIFPDAPDLNTLLVPAILAATASPFGRVNTDVQMGFINKAAIKPSELQLLLRESIISYNKDLFDGLLKIHVPVDGVFEEGRSVLHLCARIPDDKLAVAHFTSCLLELGIDLERRDNKGFTPWMDAVLGRKWDLADILLDKGANSLNTDVEGFNIMGLCIKTVNLGAIKYLLKYAGDQKFKDQFFLVNKEKQISSLQLAASLPLARAHGMKVEVMGTFLTILKYFGQDPSQINFRSDGIYAGATAIEIAFSKGVVHAVWHLAKKEGATLPSTNWVSASTRAHVQASEDYLKHKNFERCVYIVENWEKDREKISALVADWTNLKTIDESVVASSWEPVVWDYSCRRKYIKGRIYT